MEKIKSIISGLLIAVFLMLVIGCDMGGSDGGGSDGGGSSVVTYAIGDTGPSGVGIVFYITDGGLHGLEAAPSDQGTSKWIDGGSQGTTNGFTGTEIGTGLENSYAIRYQTDTTGSAAEKCLNYRGGGFAFWFLPSKDELNQLYLQKVTVGGLDSGDYWSSSEDSSSIVSSEAWLQRFHTGEQFSIDKDPKLSVRAVRAF